MSAGLVVGGSARSAKPKRKASAKVLARPAAKRVKQPKKRREDDNEDEQDENEKVSGDSGDDSKVGAPAAPPTSSNPSSSSSTSNDDEDDHDAEKDGGSADDNLGPSSTSGPAPVNCTLKANDSDSDDNLDGELPATVQAGATTCLKDVFQQHFHCVDRIHQCFGTEILQNMSKNVGNLRVASLYSGLGG